MSKMTDVYIHIHRELPENQVPYATEDEVREDVNNTDFGKLRRSRYRTAEPLRGENVASIREMRELEFLKG